MSSKTKRIMLVEDEDDLVMLFKMILESDAGLKVDSFTDPFSALDNFKPGLYDLIMIDIVLPKMNGFELYYKIRKLDDKVKICFLTAGEMYYEEIRKEAFPELDRNCFIRKPITNEALIQQVKEILDVK
jgi:DNA-binding response OmpR family regulator